MNKLFYNDDHLEDVKPFDRPGRVEAEDGDQKPPLATLNMFAKTPSPLVEPVPQNNPHEECEAEINALTVKRNEMRDSALQSLRELKLKCDLENATLRGTIDRLQKERQTLAERVIILEARLNSVS